MPSTGAHVPPAQHMDALRKGNAVRLAARELVHEVHDGRLSIEEALRDERAGSLTVLKLLMAQHRWGLQHAHQITHPMHISDLRRVRELTERQKNEIVERLAARKRK